MFVIDAAVIDTLIITDTTVAEKFFKSYYIAVIIMTSRLRILKLCALILGLYYRGLK